MIEMLTPVLKPKNRQQRNRQEAELNKCVESLFAVERRFYGDLFDEDFTYIDTYNYYLSQYRENIDWLIKNIKPRYWAINLLYFEAQFKPIEKCGEISNFKVAKQTKKSK